jgi:hypothetical protein
MTDTPARRTKKPGARDTGVGEDEASNNRKRPLEGHRLIQPHDGQVFVEPKRQKFNAQAQYEPNYYAEGLYNLAPTITEPEFIAFYSTLPLFQPPPQSTSNYLDQPGFMSYDPIQASSIQHLMSIRRSDVPEYHQSPSSPTAYLRQVHGLDSEPIIRQVDPKPTIHPEQQIAYPAPCIVEKNTVSAVCDRYTHYVASLSSCNVYSTKTAERCCRPRWESRPTK